MNNLWESTMRTLKRFMLRAAGRLIDLPYDIVKAANIYVEQYPPPFLFLVTVPLKFLVGAITFPLRLLSNYLYKKADLDELDEKIPASFQQSLQHILDDLHKKRAKSNHSFSFRTIHTHKNIHTIDHYIERILNTGSILYGVKICNNEELSQAIITHLINDPDQLSLERSKIKEWSHFFSILHNVSPDNVDKVINKICSDHVFLKKIIPNNTDLLDLLKKKNHHEDDNKKNNENDYLILTPAKESEDWRYFSLSSQHTNKIIDVILGSEELFNKYSLAKNYHDLKYSIGGYRIKIIKAMNEIYQADTSNLKEILDEIFNEVCPIEVTFNTAQHVAAFLQTLSFTIRSTSDPIKKAHLEKFRKKVAPFAETPNLKEICLGFIRNHFTPRAIRENNTKLPEDLVEEAFGFTV